MSDVTRHGTLTGYNSGRCRCDDCREAYREYRRSNAARIKERSAQYYLDNKDRILARNKKYYVDNREQEIARGVERGKRNPEGRRAAVERWRERNPGLDFARRHGCEILAVTERDWRRLCGRFAGLCAYCRSSPADQMDHVVPLSRGGRHSIGNVLPCCGTCNSSKNRRLLVEWRR